MSPAVRHSSRNGIFRKLTSAHLDAGQLFGLSQGRLLVSLRSVIGQWADQFISSVQCAACRKAYAQGMNASNAFTGACKYWNEFACARIQHEEHDENHGYERVFKEVRSTALSPPSAGFFNAKRSLVLIESGYTAVTWNVNGDLK